jgi:hypothetical protein
MSEARSSMRRLDLFVSRSMQLTEGEYSTRRPCIGFVGRYSALVHLPTVKSLIKATTVPDLNGRFSLSLSFVDVYRVRSVLDVVVEDRK